MINNIILATLLPLVPPTFLKLMNFWKFQSDPSYNVMYGPTISEKFEILKKLEIFGNVRIQMFDGSSVATFFISAPKTLENCIFSCETWWQAGILHFCSERREFLMKSLQNFRKVGTCWETLRNKVFCSNCDCRLPHTPIPHRNYTFLLVFWMFWEYQ